MSDAEKPPTWAGAPGFHPQDGEPPSDEPAAGPPEPTDTAQATDTAESSDAAEPADTVRSEEAEPAERPGYQDAEFLPPHAPMPGAPPYPAAEAPPAVSPMAPPRSDPPLWPALGAAGVWLVVNLLLWTIVYGFPGTIVGIVAQLAVTLVVALIVWLIARRKQWAFWQLVLLAAPFYWVIRLVVFPRQPF